MKVHASWAALVIALLAGFYLYARHQGTVHERDRHTADSLTANQAPLKAAQAALQDTVAASKLREAQVRRQMAGRDSALRLATGRLGALAQALRDSIGSAQQRQLDSLEGLHAATDSVLSAKAEGYRLLFEGAASQRDSALSLAHALEAQNQGLAQALVVARRTPLLNRPIVKVIALAGAFALGKWGR